MSNKTTDEILVDIFRDLDGRADFPIDEIKKKIAIISTPRCGSSMFCDVLKNTKQCGDPKEWFNHRYFSAYGRFHKIQELNFKTYLDFILKKTTSKNGIFSVNFHVDQYQHLLTNFRIDPLKLGFDYFYYLNRRDKLAQALSLTKALITDQWTSDTKAVNDLPTAIPRTKVLEQLLFISRSEDFYQSNLQKYVTHEYSYEDFKCPNDTNIFSQVLAECGIPNFPGKWETSMRQQSGSGGTSHLDAIKKYLGY